MKRPTIIVVLEKILCKLITATNNTKSFLPFFIKRKEIVKGERLTFATEEEVIDQGEDQRDALYGIL